MLLPHRAVSRLSKRPTALSINSRTGVTLASRGNSTSSKLQGLEVLSLWDSLRCSTHEGSTKKTGDVIAKSYALQAITYRRTYKNQNFFFLVHKWRGFARDPSQLSRLLHEFLHGRLCAKVVPETDYLSCFFRSHARVPQASCQADSFLTPC